MARALAALAPGPRPTCAARAGSPPSRSSRRLADTPVLAPSARPGRGRATATSSTTPPARPCASPAQNAPDLVVRLTIDTRLQAGRGQAVREAMRVGGGARPAARQAALLSLSADGGHPRHGRRHRLQRERRSTAPSRPGASRARPSSRSSTPPPWSKGVLPTDTRVDGPIKFGDWAPENYGGGYGGPVTVAGRPDQARSTPSR